jgi:hypothetical protein
MTTEQLSDTDIIPKASRSFRPLRRHFFSLMTQRDQGNPGAAPISDVFESHSQLIDV